MKLTLIAAIVNAALVCLPAFGAPAPDVPWCKDGQTPPGCRPTQQDVNPDKQSTKPKPEKCSRGGSCKDGDCYRGSGR